MIIAIDGPSGTGKSTVARGVARRLGFTFFDTGAMYRAFAWHVWNEKVSPSDEAKVVELIDSFRFEISQGTGETRTYLVSGEDVSLKIRSEEIGVYASQVAVYPKVRSAMVEMQRRFGSKSDAVFEGRDMGTVVFPHADIKIFLTAEEEVRAERRYQELLSKSEKGVDFGQVLSEMRQRDINDSTRSISPLKQAADAILIDTSHLSVEEVIDQIVALVEAPSSFPMRFIYGAVWWVSRIFFKLFFRLRVYGEDQVHPGPGIFIANHTSYFDPPILAASFHGEVHFLARESLFRVPVLGRLIRALNTHPVANDAGDLHVLRQMIGLLNSGKKLILFPEGRRSLDGELNPFARGFAFLAKKTKCTIFPTYIDGAYRAWPVSSSWPRPFGKVTCVFGKPLQWREGEGEEQFIERCSAAISALQTWLKEGAKGSPP